MLLAVLATLREQALHSDTKEIFVEMRSLTEISDAAAVILTAEMERCFKYADSKFIGGSYPPKESEAFRVLAGLGTFEFLDAGKIQAPAESRHWFSLRANHRIIGPDIGELLDHFRPFLTDFIGHVGKEWERKFYRALLDSMSNTMEHAYQFARRQPWLRRRWWAAGLVSPEQRTMRFVFWDQGVGIPRTMRSRSRIRATLGSLLSNDARLIEVATQEGKSRYRSSRRGHGLRALIELIEAAPDGTLDILSGRGRFRHRKGDPPDISNQPSDIEGTLIVWTLRKEPRA